MRTWKENDDRAVSPVVATIMMVAIAAVLATVVYAFAARPQGDAPGALSLTQQSTGIDDERAFSVAAASQEMRWGDATPVLNGVELTYDETLSADGTWCRETPDNVCLPAASVSPEDPILAGQRIRIHDSTVVSGTTFQLRDEAANALLASIAVR